MIITIHQEAFDEFLHAVDWYKERGQARKYKLSIKEGIKAIRDNPFAWQKDEDDNRFRRYVIQNFPYKIIYALHEGDMHIYIIAIAPTKRDSGYWQDRSE